MILDPIVLSVITSVEIVLHLPQIAQLVVILLDRLHQIVYVMILTTIQGQIQLV